MEHYDLIIIGAGLSGIDAACHLKMNCPKKSFKIFEARHTIGGTWDLFKYPGIRSDSDMHTFSYSFKPWTFNKSISDAETIMKYLRETVDEYGIEEFIQYQSPIKSLNWSSEEKLWTVCGQNNHSEEPIKVTCNFLVFGTGYYDYDEGYTPEYKGLENFKGRFVHPQKWTDDIDYEDKEVIVIGSGATAVTLIPSIADKTKHVTMLQRSPSYILSQPLHDPFAKVAHKLLPAKAAHSVSRWKNILLSNYLYRMSKQKPEKVKDFVKGRIRKVLGKDFDVDTHFNPRYNPWDERLCSVPDNDLFLSIQKGDCTMVTAHIDTFTEEGILLKNGKELKADLIISATGLKLKLIGGIDIRVDNEPFDISSKLQYKGAMVQDLPNALAIIGYTNAAWTLKADLVCRYLCRLLNHMEENNLQVCYPALSEEDMDTAPVIDFTSGYIQRSLDKLPKQGKKHPWKLDQNYIKDRKTLGKEAIEDGILKFR